MTIDIALAGLMERMPELNAFGIGMYYEHKKLPLEKQAQINAENRAELLGSVDRVSATVEWLRSNVAPIRTFNKHHTSYSLKHIAEKEIGYITNGVFIAAGIIAGYKYKILPASPNVLFAMSSRSINEVIGRINRRAS